MIVKRLDKFSVITENSEMDDITDAFWVNTLGFLFLYNRSTLSVYNYLKNDPAECEWKLAIELANTNKAIDRQGYVDLNKEIKKIQTRTVASPYEESYIRILADSLRKIGFPMSSKIRRTLDSFMEASITLQTAIEEFMEVAYREKRFADFYIHIVKFGGMTKLPKAPEVAKKDVNAFKFKTQILKPANVTIEELYVVQQMIKVLGYENVCKVIALNHNVEEKYMQELIVSAFNVKSLDSVLLSDIDVSNETYIQYSEKITKKDVFSIYDIKALASAETNMGLKGGIFLPKYIKNAISSNERIPLQFHRVMGLLVADVRREVGSCLLNRSKRNANADVFTTIDDIFGISTSSASESSIEVTCNIVIGSGMFDNGDDTVIDLFKYYNTFTSVEWDSGFTNIRKDISTYFPQALSDAKYSPEKDTFFNTIHTSYNLTGYGKQTSVNEAIVKNIYEYVINNKNMKTMRDYTKLATIISYCQPIGGKYTEYIDKTIIETLLSGGKIYEKFKELGVYDVIMDFFNYEDPIFVNASKYTESVDTLDKIFYEYIKRYKGSSPIVPSTYAVLTSPAYKDYLYENLKANKFARYDVEELLKVDQSSRIPIIIGQDREISDMFLKALMDGAGVAGSVGLKFLVEYLKVYHDLPKIIDMTAYKSVDVMFQQQHVVVNIEIMKSTGKIYTTSTHIDKCFRYITYKSEKELFTLDVVDIQRDYQDEFAEILAVVLKNSNIIAKFKTNDNIAYNFMTYTEVKNKEVKSAMMKSMISSKEAILKKLKTGDEAVKALFADPEIITGLFDDDEIISILNVDADEVSDVENTVLGRIRAIQNMSDGLSPKVYSEVVSKLLDALVKKDARAGVYHEFFTMSDIGGFVFKLIKSNEPKKHEYVEKVMISASNYYGSMSKATSEIIAKNIVKSSLVDEIHNSDNLIMPNFKLTTEEVVKILQFNNFKVDLGSVKLKAKSDDESFEDYLNTCYAEIETHMNTKKVPKLSLTKIDLTPEELDIETVQMARFYNKKHGDIGAIVEEVFEITLPMTQGLKEFKKMHPKPTVIPAFHGTGSIAASMIMRFGFKILTASIGNLKVVAKMLGDGIYISNSLSKSLLYIGDAGYGRSSGGEVGYIIVSDAYIGKKGVNHESAGLGGDSILSPEWVIFDASSQMRMKRLYKIRTCRGEVVRATKARLIDSGVIKAEDYTRIHWSKLIQESANTDGFNYSDDELDDVERNTISYIFYDNYIPESSNNLVHFSDYKYTKSDKYEVEQVQNGTMVTFIVSNDLVVSNRVIMVPNTVGFVKNDNEGLYSQFEHLYKKAIE